MNNREKLMNIDDIKKLIELMVENGLSELDIENGQTKVSLKRGSGGQVITTAVPVMQAPTTISTAAATPAVPDAAAPVDNIIEIKSPMVGTFYAASSPDSDPYIKVDSRVDDETVICIVEAMKVMNEIKAECRGTIVEVCVRNAQPVEFGQVLFKVKPA